MSPVLLGVALLGGGAVVMLAVGRGLSWLALHNIKREIPPLDPDPEYVNVSDLLDRIEPYRQAADEAIEQANSWPSHTVPPRYVAPNPYPPYRGGAS